MEIEINQDNALQLRKVFNGVTLRTESGEEMRIWMRDSGFEFNYEGQVWSAKEGHVGMMKESDRGNILVDQSEVEEKTSPSRDNKVEKINCYEIHRPNIPQFGCTTQCKECEEYGKGRD